MMAKNNTSDTPMEFNTRTLPSLSSIEERDRGRAGSVPQHCSNHFSSHSTLQNPPVDSPTTGLLGGSLIQLSR